jgi:hypothetical protein
VFEPCDLGANQTAGTKSCQGVEEPTASSIADFAQDYGTKPEYLAIANGRREGDAVNPKSMRFLLVPTSKAGS